MRKGLFILAICMFAGCANKADQAQKVAGSFLEAFIANDFKGATQMCSDNFKEEFGKTVADFENLPDQVKQMLKEQCSQIKYEIMSVERVEKSDTFVVNNNIARVQQDTSSFQQQPLASSSLKIVGGKVDRLNK